MGTKNFFTLFYPIIESFNKGSLIRKIMSFLFYLTGILVFLGGCYLFFRAIGHAPDIWFILQLLFVLVSAFIILQIWFFHAKEIVGLVDSEFMVIPIFSHLFRSIGESYSVCILGYGMGRIINVLLSKESVGILQFEQLLLYKSYTSLIEEAMSIIYSIVLSFFVLLFTYFVAESILALVQIAKNTSITKKNN
ncbi:hypothetical protein FJZ17_04565 [Candidatus Pacearchaeota archaeon]|nr:hypothetical protein [Candidatus Pacearchaeota archaeon]